MTASFETRPSGTAIARRAWRSSVEAFGQMKPLFLSATVISLALGYATFHVPFFQSHIFKSDTLLTPDIFATYTAIDLVSILAWTAVDAPVAVAMHRFILMGQTTSGFSHLVRAIQNCFFFGRRESE
jgi:hypothetical protein